MGEVIINGRVYIVSARVLKFIEELAETKRIDEMINARIRKMLLALDQHGMLSVGLDTEYPLPPSMESKSGKWTFYDVALMVARNGLKAGD